MQSDVGVEERQKKGSYTKKKSLQFRGRIKTILTSLEKVVWQERWKHEYQGIPNPNFPIPESKSLFVGGHRRILAGFYFYPASSPFSTSVSD